MMEQFEQMLERYREAGITCFCIEVGKNKGATYEDADRALAAESDAKQALLDLVTADSARLDLIEQWIYEGKPLPEYVPAEYDGPYCTAQSGFQMGSTGGGNLREAVDRYQAALNAALPPRGRPNQP